jgi:hypothetical protein
MTAAGLSPDHTTRLLLLRLYAQTGKIAEARAEFDTLRSLRQLLIFHNSQNEKKKETKD